MTPEREAELVEAVERAIGGCMHPIDPDPKHRTQCAGCGQWYGKDIAFQILSATKFWIDAEGKFHADFICGPCLFDTTGHYDRTRNPRSYGMPTIRTKE